MGVADIIVEGTSSPPRRKRRKKRGGGGRSGGSSKRPVVGVRGLDQARLSSAARATLQRRAERAADREFAPQIALAEQAVDQAQHYGRREIQSIEGATNIVDRSLDQQLKDLKDTGLEGRYLKDAIENLTNRQADLPTSEQFLKADVRADRREEVSGAKTDLAQLQADQQTEAAKAFTSLLNNAFTDAEGALDTQRKAGQDEKQSGGASDSEKERKENRKERKAMLKAAMLEGNRLLTTFADDPPDSDEDWAKFEDLVAQAEGVDGVHAGQIAATATAILRALHSLPGLADSVKLGG